MMALADPNTDYEQMVFCKTDRLPGFALSREEFEVLGTQILSTLNQFESRDISFTFVRSALSREETNYNELDAFLLMEEISYLLDRYKGAVHEKLTHIYRAVKAQAYAEYRVTIQAI